MYFGEFEKITIDNFRGLYKRGLADECPFDHAICCENVVFNKRGEVSSRPGMAASVYLAHDCRRMFLSVIDSTNRLLTLDSSGNIYHDDDATPIFTDATVVDFVGLNIYNKTYILPIVASGSPPNLQVWTGSGTTRDAAGLAPASSFSAADGSSGNVDPGDYLIAISYITDTGFVTQPGPKSGTFTPVTYTAPGSKQIDLSSLPIGPTGTVGRQILITKANLKEYFYVPELNGGLINDNTTTTATLDFFDTDLVDSADDLFDLRETIPGTVTAGTLNRYHNRVVIVTFSDDLLISESANPESFNQVTGICHVPGEGGLKITFSVVILRDVLYAMQFPGIWAIQDNGQEPSFWAVVQIDGGVGSGASGIGTIGADKNAESSGDSFLLSDIGGIFIFDGTVKRPALTWKIGDLWKTVNWNAFFNISLFIDVFHETFYVLVPQAPSVLPNLLLVADYSDGLDPDKIKWSIFTFPFTPSCIAMMDYAGNMDGSDIAYYFHISFYGNSYIYKIHDGYFDDIGAAINAYYQTALVAPKDSQGNVNIFRGLRFRAKGFGSLNLELDPEDFDPALAIVPPVITLGDPISKDLDRQINWQYEKLSVAFGTSAFANNPIVGEYFTVARLDIFAKNQFIGRPQ